VKTLFFVTLTMIFFSGCVSSPVPENKNSSLLASVPEEKAGDGDNNQDKSFNELKIEFIDDIQVKLDGINKKNEDDSVDNFLYVYKSLQNE